MEPGRRSCSKNTARAHTIDGVHTGRRIRGSACRASALRWEMALSRRCDYLGRRGAKGRSPLESCSLRSSSHCTGDSRCRRLLPDVHMCRLPVAAEK
jgi:hypothetical protein